MKNPTFKSLLFLITMTSLPVLHCYGQRPKSEEALKVDRANDKISTVYDHLMSNLEEHQKKNLLEAQRSWIKWRDSEASLRASFNTIGGESYRQDYFNAQSNLIEKRIVELNSYLKTSQKQSATPDINGNRNIYDPNDNQEPKDGQKVKINPVDFTTKLEKEGGPPSSVIVDLASKMIDSDPRWCVPKYSQRTSNVATEYKAGYTKNRIVSVKINNEYTRTPDDEKVFIFDLAIKVITVAGGEAFLEEGQGTLSIAIVKRGDAWYTRAVPK